MNMDFNSLQIIRLNSIIKQQAVLIAGLKQETASKSLELINLRQVLEFTNSWEKDQKAIFQKQVDELTDRLKSANSEIAKLKAKHESGGVVGGGGGSTTVSTAAEGKAQEFGIKSQLDVKVTDEPASKSRKMCHDKFFSSKTNQPKKSIQPDVGQIAKIKHQLQDVRIMLTCMKNDFTAFSNANSNSLKMIEAEFEKCLKELINKNSQLALTDAKMIDLSCSNLKLSKEKDKLENKLKNAKQNGDILLNKVRSLIDKIEK